MREARYCQLCGKYLWTWKKSARFCSQLCGRRGRKSLSIQERFRKYFAAGEPDACWEWTGNRDRKGYGIFGVGPRGMHRTYTASRYALAVDSGEVDADGFVTSALHALHHCDNPACVNPKHLFWGTNLDNIRDRHAKGRTPAGPTHVSVRKPWLVSRGESAERSRLKESDIPLIRARCAGGESQSAVAMAFGVSRTCIQCVVERRTWAHVA